MHALLLVASAASAAAWARRHSLASTALVVWAALGARSLERAAIRMAQALEAGDLDEARRLAPTLVGRDPSALDEAELCRAVVESVAENTNDAVVAPLLWSAVFGAAGAAGYRAANTLDAMVGNKSDRYRDFGWFSARLDDVASFVPARVTAMLAIALAPAGTRREAWHAAWRDGAAHPSPNAGRVEGAFAGALGVTLGGLNRYPYGAERRPTLGEGRVPEVDDIGRAVTLSRLVGVAALGLALAVARR